MTSFRSRALPLIAVILLAPACERGLDLAGTVTVPASIARMFSAEHRGAVVLDGVIPKVGLQPRTVAVLCDAAPGDTTIHLERFEFGCVESGPGTMTAWVAPLPADVVQTCDPTAALEHVGLGPLRDAAVAVGTQAVTVDAGGLGCGDGRVSFALTLEASP
jgi:hypothetical protein